MSEVKVGAEKLVNELTELLVENGCSVNREGMAELAIFVLKRERAILDNTYKNFEKILGKDAK